MPPREAMINREASAARVEYARVGIYGIYVTMVKKSFTLVGCRTRLEYVISVAGFSGMSRRPSDRRKNSC